MTQLVRFEVDRNGSPVESWGLRSRDGIHDLGILLSSCPTMMDAIGEWGTLEEKVKSFAADAPLLTDDAIRILSPVPDTGKVICIGLNYRDHAIETGADIPTEPVVFSKLPGALCNPGDTIPLPRVSQQVDYEAELVVVIGKRAWQVDEASANDCIFGYTCGHDVSARDWQKGRPGGQWLLGKSFPNFAPLGPNLVPKEHVADPCQLAISMRINGETMQDSSTEQLIFNPWQLIAHLSQCFVLNPGDVIFTGTPPGVGIARKPPRLLQHGDICEVEIQGLGVLQNPVANAS